jgi:hypothetical protein
MLHEVALGAHGLTPGSHTGRRHRPCVPANGATHVRLMAEAYDTAIGFLRPATLPYVCFHQTPAGPVPDICTEVACAYRTNDEKARVHVTLDLNLPVEAPHEGFSAP